MARASQPGDDGAVAAISVCIQAVLADTQFVPLPGPNLAEIRADFDVAAVPEDFDAQSLVAAVTECDRARSIALLRNSRRQLETRAQNNFAWWPHPMRHPEETRRRADTIGRMCNMLWYHRIDARARIGRVSNALIEHVLPEPLVQEHVEDEVVSRILAEVLGTVDAAVVEVVHHARPQMKPLIVEHQGRLLGAEDRQVKASRRCSPCTTNSSCGDNPAPRISPLSRKFRSRCSKHLTNR
jgi:hypothetical protein